MIFIREKSLLSAAGWLLRKQSLCTVPGRKASLILRARNRGKGRVGERCFKVPNLLSLLASFWLNSALCGSATTPVSRAKYLIPTRYATASSLSRPLLAVSPKCQDPAGVSKAPSLQIPPLDGFNRPEAEPPPPVKEKVRPLGSLSWGTPVRRLWGREWPYRGKASPGYRRSLSARTCAQNYNTI